MRSKIDITPPPPPMNSQAQASLPLRGRRSNTRIDRTLLLDRGGVATFFPGSEVAALTESAMVAPEEKVEFQVHKIAIQDLILCS